MQTTMKPSWSRRFALLLATALVAALALVGLEGAPAFAGDTDTYPWPTAPCEFGSAGGSSCTNPNNSADKYDWYLDKNGDGIFTGGGCGTSSPSGECFDKFGYEYRNCTSYVAQKISQVFGKNVSGWGDAANWDNAAVAAGYTLDAAPQVGDIAVWDGTTSNPFGHVAYIYALSSGVPMLDEYNHSGTGSFDSTRVATADHYIHIGTAPVGADSPDGEDIIKVEKRYQSDGTNLLYFATGDHVYEHWWNSSGSGTTTIATASGIVDFDVQLNSDGEHLLYTATSEAVYETWWYPGGSGPSNAARLIAASGIRKIQKTITNGVQQLYTMTNTGAYEYWWYAGTGQINGPGVIMTLANPVSMVKVIEPDGSQAIYLADAEYVYQVRWGTSAGLRVSVPIIDISQRTIRDIDVQNMSDGRHLLVTAADTSVWESSWYPPSSPTDALSVTQQYVAGGSGNQVVESRASDGASGVTHDVFVATPGGVFEYWWMEGGTVNPFTVTSQSNVHDFDKQTNPDGAQAVYTAAGRDVFESWWVNGGDGVHTGNPPLI